MADGYFRQRLDIRFVREEVTVSDLDPALEGLKIALIADLHLSSWQGDYDLLERQWSGSAKRNLTLC